jgi:pimeloyl-ACP methyl ester carboxylesterase
MRLTFLLAAAGLALAAPTTAAAPKPAYRAYVDGRWGQIHVRVAGPATGPTVVLVHKMVWSSIEFAKAQPRLAALGIRSIVVDLPGYGLSDGPAAQLSAEDYADDLLPILNHFKVSRAVMVGANTGATLVAAFAASPDADRGGGDGRPADLHRQGPDRLHGREGIRPHATAARRRAGRALGGNRQARRRRCADRRGDPDRAAAVLPGGAALSLRPPGDRPVSAARGARYAGRAGDAAYLPGRPTAPRVADAETRASGVHAHGDWLDPDDRGLSGARPLADAIAGYVLALPRR